MFDQLSIPGAVTSNNKSVRSWRLANRTAFIFKENTQAYNDHLESLKGLHPHLILVKDITTDKIAVFTSEAEAAAYFGMGSASPAWHRQNRGYCVPSRTLWHRYIWQAFTWRKLPLKIDNSRQFMIHGYNYVSCEHRLFYGLDEAAAASKMRSWRLKAMVEDTVPSLSNGWIFEIATVAAVLKYFPKWQPNTFQFEVSGYKTVAEYLITNNDIGFSKRRRLFVSDPPAIVWGRIRQAHFESLLKSSKS